MKAAQFTRIAAATPSAANGAMASGLYGHTRPSKNTVQDWACRHHQQAQARLHALFPAQNKESRARKRRQCPKRVAAHNPQGILDGCGFFGAVQEDVVDHIGLERIAQRALPRKIHAPRQNGKHHAQQKGACTPEYPSQPALANGHNALA